MEARFQGDPVPVPRYGKCDGCGVTMTVRSFEGVARLATYEYPDLHLRKTDPETGEEYVEIVGNPLKGTEGWEEEVWWHFCPNCVEGSKLKN